MAKKNEVVKEMGKLFLRGAWWLAEPFLASHILPTYIRNYDKYKIMTPLRMVLVPSLLGMFELSVGVVGVANFFDGEKYPNAYLATLPLAFTLTTNAISGLYELYLKARKNVMAPVSPATPIPWPVFPPVPPSVSPLIPPYHGVIPVPSPPSTSADEKSLEKKVEDRRRFDIPNPWDIDIPKIENIAGGEYNGR